MKMIYGFDLLKIISATLIVFHHYQQLFSIRFEHINFFGGFTSFGILVELFFMISGFLTSLTPPQKRYTNGQTGGAENFCVFIQWLR